MLAAGALAHLLPPLDSLPCNRYASIKQMLCQTEITFKEMQDVDNILNAMPQRKPYRIAYATADARLNLNRDTSKWLILFSYFFVFSKLHCLD